MGSEIADAPFTVASEPLGERATDNGQPECRPDSPVSSLMRYVESPELEADLSDIEMALQTASREDLRGENTASECMRLPSLKRQALLDEPRWEQPLSEDSRSQPRKETDLREHCGRCQEKGLEVCQKWLKYKPSVSETNNM
jgi:hypothetical protein